MATPAQDAEDSAGTPQPGALQAPAIGLVTPLLQRFTGGHQTGRFSGCWGYTDSVTGREYAIACCAKGVLIVDATPPLPVSPAQPVHWFLPEPDPLPQTWLPGKASDETLWRAAVTHGTWLYVTNWLHPGIWVIDLSERDGSGRIVPKNGSPAWVAQQHITQGAHRIAVSDTGMLYCSGILAGLSELQVYDVNPDPADPCLVARPSVGTHDTFVRGDRAYVATPGLNTHWEILEVAGIGCGGPVPQRLHAWPSVSSPAHSCWVDEDSARMYAVYEVSRPYCMDVWDLTAQPAPARIGLFGIDAGEMLHNLHGIGKTGYAAHYAWGFQLLDLRDPANIIRVLGLDTSDLPEGRFNGAWDIAVRQDSGLIHLSNVEDGLWILRVDAGHMNREEAGTSNGQSVPRLSAQHGPPRSGREFRITVRGMRGGTGSGLLLLGPARTPRQTQFGVNLYIDLRSATAWPCTPDPSGEAVVTLPIPDVEVSPESRIYCQLLELDPVQGFVGSSRLTWFGIAP